MKNKIIAGTGHRPHKFGGYSDAVIEKLRECVATILMGSMPQMVISGMALGFDQALALAAIGLDIPVTAALPFKGQEYRWPADAQDRYKRILRRCDKIILVTDGSNPKQDMLTRNMWMVDNCQEVLAMWDGSPGGTAHCVSYATKKRIPVNNQWGLWDNYQRAVRFGPVFNRLSS